MYGNVQSICQFMQVFILEYVSSVETIDCEETTVSAHIFIQKIVTNSWQLTSTPHIEKLIEKLSLLS